MLKTRQELATIPFSERPAFLLKQDDLDVYVANEARSAIRNQRFSLSAISKPTLSDSDNDPQKSHLLHKVVILSLTQIDCLIFSTLKVVKQQFLLYSLPVLFQRYNNAF